MALLYHAEMPFPHRRASKLRAGLQALLAVVLALAAGCGDGATAPSEGPSELELARSDPAAPPPRAIDPAQTGRVHGRVTFRGDPPTRREIPLVRECQVHPEPLLDEGLVVGVDGGLADVLVHVKRGLAGWEIPPPASGGPPPRLDQHGCAYRPHVLTLRAGQTLSVENSDPLAHNVRLRAPRNGLDSNRTQGRGGPALEFPFERRELSVRVACDLHPWMGAVVHVLDHPFFALTGADGAFAIEGLPPGTYEVEALHPELGRQRLEVEVQAGGDHALPITFAEE